MADVIINEVGEVEEVIDLEPIEEPNIVKKQSGCKFIKEFKDGESIVAMVGYRGTILLATNTTIYEVDGEIIKPLKLIERRENSDA